MLPTGHDGGYDDKQWAGDGVLRVHRFGEEWSVWRWLDSRREWSRHFYVNLEDPWRRSALGFDTGDWLLDVVGTPTSWAYKDEDELEWAEDAGLVGSAWSARTREAGKRAAAALKANAWPFDADWNRWLPSVDLATPVLPTDWSVVAAPGTGV
jgi:predicted RNA-binding protein associated with RNAse of E/G family